MVACSYFDSCIRLYQFHKNLKYLELWLYILCWHFHIKQSVQTPLTSCNLITKDIENPKINVDIKSVAITPDWVSVQSGVNVLSFIQLHYGYPSLGFNISLYGSDFFCAYEIGYFPQCIVRYHLNGPQLAKMKK